MLTSFTLPAVPTGMSGPGGGGSSSPAVPPPVDPGGVAGIGIDEPKLSIIIMVKSPGPTQLRTMARRMKPPHPTATQVQSELFLLSSAIETTPYIMRRRQ